MAHIARLVKKIISSVTGLVSFKTNVEEPVKVMCEFSSVQEGTGDPSPDNVRPISGWTGCEITHTGKNLLDSSSLVSGKYIDNNGHEQTNSSFGYTRPYSAILPNTTYILSGSWTHQHDYYCAVYFYDTNKEWIKRNVFDSGLTTYTFTTPKNAGYIRVQYYKSLANAQVETGSTVTSFEPFQGYTVIPIAFTDPTTGDPLTVYGGTVTLNEDGSVDLVSKSKLFDLGNLTWLVDSNRLTFYYATVSSIVANNNNVIATCYKSVAPQGIGAWRTDTRDLIIGQRSSTSIAIIDTNYNNDVQGLKTSLNGQYAMILTPPTTYHFDNVGQLQSFLGTNNIWHNMNGDITVEYYNYQ